MFEKKKKDKPVLYDNQVLAIMAAILYTHPSYGEFKEAIVDAAKILDEVDDFLDKEDE